MERTKNRTPQNHYTIAMSEETGCVVMLMNGRVLGSMQRDMSVQFGQGIVNWKPSVAQAVSDQIPKPVLALVSSNPHAD